VEDKDEGGVELTWKSTVRDGQALETGSLGGRAMFGMFLCRAIICTSPS